MGANKPKVTRTGIQEDLQAVITLAEGNGLERVKQLLADPSSSRDELRDVLPKGFLRTAFLLMHPGLKSFLGDLPSEIRPFFDRAGHLVTSELPDLFDHPAAQTLLHEELEEAVKAKKRFQETRQKEGTAGLSPALHTIASISAMPMWIGSSPNLIPALRVGFSDHDNKLLLDSTLDWDDALFLVASIIDAVERQMDKGRALMSARQALLPPELRKRVERRLRKIQQHLRGIAGLASIYGVESEAVSAGLRKSEGKRE